MPMPDKQVKFLEQNCRNRNDVKDLIDVLRRGNKIRFKNKLHGPEQITTIINRVFNKD